MSKFAFPELISVCERDKMKTDPVAATNQRSSLVVDGHSLGSCVLMAHERVAVNVLHVSSSPADSRSMGQILANGLWKLVSARSAADASAAMASQSFAIVVCDYQLSDGSWQDIRSRLSELAHPPVLIVTCSCDNDAPWAEALSLGVYDVLAKPLEAAEVLDVLLFAWDAQYRKQPSIRASWAKSGT